MRIPFSTNIFSKPSPFLKERGKEHVAVIGAIVVGIIILIWSVLSFLNINNQEATLVLAFEDEGRGRMFSGQVIRGMTILEALIVSSEAGQIDLDYRLNSNDGAKIVALNGYYNDSPNGNMAIYLNEHKIDERDIYKVEIRPGDKIEFKLK